MTLGRWILAGLGVLVLCAAAAGWFVTRPQPLGAERIAALPEGDAAAGERVFWAGGCASCHLAPGAESLDSLELSGGLELVTEFGTFVVPNISSHPEDGIGDWTLGEFANAMLRGLSPEGRHYYPAFPYTSYARMSDEDLSDLFAFLQTLPAVAGTTPDHALGLPYNIRRGVGLWKRVNLDPAPVIAIDESDPQLVRGRELVEGLGHCGECHTPRSSLGGLDTSRWLAGAPAPEGDGEIPNITPSEAGIGDWDAFEIAAYLETGFTPDFDSAGGEMAAVIRNLARLPAEDREAIAAYLKAVPPIGE